MSWEYPPEEKECICRFCGEESEGTYCNKECKKAYESEN
jgi:hypothetical protein